MDAKRAAHRRGYLHAAVNAIAVVAAIALPCLYTLHSRCRTYDSFILVPKLSPAFASKQALGEWLWGRIGMPLHRDASDVQWMMALQRMPQIGIFVLITWALSMLVDTIATKKLRRLQSALRLRVALIYITAFVGLWKLHGLMWFAIFAYAAGNFTLVLALSKISSISPWTLRASIIVVWVYNIAAVVLMSPNMWSKGVSRWLWQTTLHADEWVGWLIGSPGNLEWTGSLKFCFFKCTSFATSALLDSDAARESGPGINLGVPIPGVASICVYFSYVFYFPLFWQGPTMLARDFWLQLQSRYKSKSSKRQSGVLRAAVSTLAFAIVLEIVNHWLFFGMLVLGGKIPTMPSSEGVLALLGHVFALWLRMVVWWRVFRVWALLDGVRVCDNFGRVMFFCRSVSELWRNFNVSVHQWTASCIFVPFSTLLCLPSEACTVITFVIIAGWHARNTTWLLWGVVNAVLIIAERGRRDTLPKYCDAPFAWFVAVSSWVARVVISLSVWMAVGDNNLTESVSRVVKLGRKMLWYNPISGNELYQSPHPYEGVWTLLGTYVALFAYRVFIDAKDSWENSISVGNQADFENVESRADPIKLFTDKAHCDRRLRATEAVLGRASSCQTIAHVLYDRAKGLAISLPLCGSIRSAGKHRSLHLGSSTRRRALSNRSFGVAEQSPAIELSRVSSRHRVYFCAVWVLFMRACCLFPSTRHFLPQLTARQKFQNR